MIYIHRMSCRSFDVFCKQILTDLTDSVTNVARGEYGGTFFEECRLFTLVRDQYKKFAADVYEITPRGEY